MSGEWASLADVEQFRGLKERRAVVQEVGRPALVLGSTQPDDVLDRAALERAGVEVVRRRGGGGAVLLHPGDHLWVDVWVPRGDPLWVSDVAAAARWVGEWWCAALGTVGIDGCAVYGGTAAPGRYGHVVCFSGRGPGEVFWGEAKVMGLSQWRSREGALFHACSYARWDADPLVGLLDLAEGSRTEWRSALRRSAVGIAELQPDGSALEAVRRVLLDSLTMWGLPPGG